MNFKGYVAIFILSIFSATAIAQTDIPGLKEWEGAYSMPILVNKRPLAIINNSIVAPLIDTFIIHRTLSEMDDSISRFYYGKDGVIRLIERDYDKDGIYEYKQSYYRANGRLDSVLWDLNGDNVQDSIEKYTYTSKGDLSSLISCNMSGDTSWNERFEYGLYGLTLWKQNNKMYNYFYKNDILLKVIDIGGRDTTFILPSIVEENKTKLIAEREHSIQKRNPPEVDYYVYLDLFSRVHKYQYRYNTLDDSEYGGTHYIYYDQNKNPYFESFWYQQNGGRKTNRFPSKYNNHTACDALFDGPSHRRAVTIPESGRWAFEVCNTDFTPYITLSTDTFCHSNITLTESVCDQGGIYAYADILAGKYFMTIGAKNKNDTGAYSLNIYKEWGLGVDKPSLQSLFEVYPNPATDHLIIEGPLAQVATCRIVDVYGRVLLSPVMDKEINVEELAHGTYFIVLQDAKGSTQYRSKFIKL